MKTDSLTHWQKKHVVYGGFFDPLHQIHANIVRKAKDEYGLKRLFLVPCNNQSKKVRRTPFLSRLEMTKAAVESLNTSSLKKVYVASSCYEHASNLYEAVKTLFPFFDYRKTRIPYIIGSDSNLLHLHEASLLQQFGTLKQAQRFYNHVVFLVNPTRGIKNIPKNIEIGNKTIAIESKMLRESTNGSISSTQLREAIAKGDDISSDAIEHSVMKIIEERGLYGRPIKTSPVLEKQKAPYVLRYLFNRVKELFFKLGI